MSEDQRLFIKFQRLGDKQNVFDRRSDDIRLVKTLSRGVNTCLDPLATERIEHYWLHPQIV